MRLARPYPGELFEKAAAEPRRLDPETAISCLTALGSYGQPGNSRVRGAGLLLPKITRDCPVKLSMASIS